MLLAAGLFTFSLAYLAARQIEKKGYEDYAAHIIGLGFLLICISFLVTRGPPVLPLKIIYYITYVSGIICTIVAPGIYIKKQFPEKLSSLLLAAPSAAIPFLFYGCAGNSCDMEYVKIYLYSIYPVFEFFGAVMLSIMAFGLIALCCIAFEQKDSAEKIWYILSIAVLLLLSLFSGLITGGVLAGAYFYLALKEKNIRTGGKRTIILFVAAGAIALLIHVLENNYIACVNACTSGLLEILAFSFIILGTTDILMRTRSPSEVDE